MALLLLAEGTEENWEKHDEPRTTAAVHASAADAHVLARRAAARGARREAAAGRDQARRGSCRPGARRARLRPRRVKETSCRPMAAGSCAEPCDDSRPCTRC